MKAPVLTREALLDGSAREYILRNSELRRLVLPDADREASLRATLRESPAMGPCCDYLFETVEHLAALGSRDRRLEAMAGKVRARLESLAARNSPLPRAAPC